MKTASLRFLVFLLVIGSFLISLAMPEVASAALESCTASISPSTITPSTTSGFTLTINNTGSANIVFIKVTSPSGNFSITSYSAASWSGSVSPSEATFTGGSITPGTSSQIILSVRSGSSLASSANWSIEASDAGDGSGRIGCTGSLGTAIEGSPPDTTAPVMSGITVSDITNNTARVSFTTDEATTGEIDYGTTSGAEDLSSEDTTLSTSHSFTLSGLTTNTTYYFYLTARDANGNTVASDESVLTTASTTSSGTATVTTTTTSTTTTQTVTTTVEKIVKDTTKPRISLDTDFEKVYQQAPIVIGEASDASGISRVEYSFDDGKNWLAVDEVSQSFAKTITFSFLPDSLLDGNYSIRARATDTAGNIQITPSQVLIIDRLPPQVGLLLWSVGPLVLPTNLQIGENTQAKVTLSAVGGPTSIELRIAGQTFPLVKNDDTGLWSGNVTLQTAGEYPIETFSIDGADNKTTGKSGRITVLPSGKTNVPTELKVFYFEPTQSRYVVWDGRPFLQNNPQKTNAQGYYSLLLPAGKYYLEATAPGHRMTRTEIFEISETTHIATDFELQPKTRWWQFFQVDQIRWSGNVVPKTAEETPATQLPFFALPTSTGELVYSNSLRGAPTVLTFLTSWVPTTSEQLLVLDKVAQNKNYKVYAVFEQQPLSAVGIFKKRGDYKSTMIIDADGELLKPLNIGGIPTHLFIDRKGVIQKIVTGVLTEQEIMHNLNN
jgi:hypothetical protein